MEAAKRSNLRIDGELEQITQLKDQLSLWVCDVDFWKDEVDDCQKILEKHLPQIDELEERKRLEQFQNQIIYYRDELLDKMKHDLLLQLKHLDESFNIARIIQHQDALHQRLNAIEQQMKERRRQLTLFINNI